MKGEKHFFQKKKKTYDNVSLIKQLFHQEIEPWWSYFNQDSAVIEIDDYVCCRKISLLSKKWTMKLFASEIQTLKCLGQNSLCLLHQPQICAVFWREEKSLTAREQRRTIAFVSRLNKTVHNDHKNMIKVEKDSWSVNIEFVA